MSSLEKKSSHRSNSFDSNMASDYHLEMRLDRMEKRLLKWFQVLGGALFATFAVAVWALISAHSVNQTILEIPTPEPMTTDIATVPAYEVGFHQHDKRFLWFLGAALYVGNLAFSLYGLASACTDYVSDGSAKNGVICVYSAVSTAASLIGLAGKGLVKAGEYAGSIAAEGVQIGLATLGKRDIPALEAYAHNTSTVFPNIDYSHHGFLSANSTQNGHLVPEGFDLWPVSVLTNHHGHVFHHMVVPKPGGRTFNRLGYAGTVSSNKKRQDGGYEGEYFTAGALDFTSCEAGDSEQLNTGDFANMEAEIECYIPDETSDAGIEVQVYDATTMETIGAGSIGAVGPNGETSFNDMPQCPNSLPTSNCGAMDTSTG